MGSKGRERGETHFCKKVFSSTSPSGSPAPAAVAATFPLAGLSKTMGGGDLMVRMSKSPFPPGCLFAFPSVVFFEGVFEADDADLGSQA